MKTIIRVLIAALFVLLAASAMPHAAYVGRSGITAPAVDLGTDMGSVTRVQLNITTGNGTVEILGPSHVANDTLDSAIAAAKYASVYMRMNFSHYNFIYQINDNMSNVSGPSAGAAMTVLAISAFANVPTVPNFTMTGTIGPNGAIGEIGGVYNKADASKAAGARFMLVPLVPQGSFENSLYVLAQDTFNLPLVQVSNISQAIGYAIYGQSVSGLKSSYPSAANYNVSQLQEGTQLCSACNMSAFQSIANFTFNLTHSEISSMQMPNLSEPASSLQATLNSSEQIAAKGYIYAGADLAFLDYINAFFFSNNMVNATTGLSLISNVQSKCQSLTPPQLTASNYEYVIAGEIRQGWGNYTAFQLASAYNVTGMDNDQVLEAVSAAGSANAWCSAASEMYNISAAMGGPAVMPAANLSSLAYSRITEMQSYYGNSITIAASGVGTYGINAESAYKAGNYPVAIIDADYAIATHREGELSQLESTGNILNSSNTIIQNATFGAWPTQFALEARFYMAEARLNSANSTLSRYYAEEAYMSSVLASTLSNDTRRIYGSLVPVSNTAGSNGSSTNAQVQNSQMLVQLQDINNRLSYILIAITAILVIDIIIAIVLVFAVFMLSAKRPKDKKKEEKNNRNNTYKKGI